MLPIGLLIGACYWVGAQGLPWIWLLAIPLVFVRMFLGTLDGLVATHYGKGSRKGELVNRLAPELCDVFTMLALALARPEWMVPGILGLAASWMITFSGLVGATAGLPTQSVGPAGQTDRLATLQLATLLAFFAETRHWPVDVFALYLWWVWVGGAITVALRLRRNFKAASQAP
jgi:phosphatidylglycerophosphate synthase